ncbi:DUF2461 domain-containing protein [Chitinibacteraceae bacterium HSL-7]
MPFSQATYAFLSALAVNNSREWFEAHREDYELHVRSPALDFIESMALPLADIAPGFRADARKAGGSLMRIHRDTRFSNNKSPYKTNIGIQFRHVLGKDVHAPGWYVHIAPEECFVGVGCWHPEPEALRKLRDAVLTDPEQWLAARDDAAFRRTFSLQGDVLKRMPSGYPADHVAAEDLRRKDFIAGALLDWDTVVGGGLLAFCRDAFADAQPFMRWQCKALGLNL